jgi:hypothetical protein
LPHGRQLVTLKDAGEYIQSLPKAQQNATPWRNATEVLLLVVERNGPTMFARIAMMQALNSDCRPPQKPANRKTRQYRIIK